MSNEAKNDLSTFLAKFSALVLGFILLVSSIYGFVKLFAEKDVGLFTLVSFMVGILLLLGICLDYAHFWFPEAQDKSPSAFALSSDEQVKAQQQKEKQRKTVRRSAIAGFVLIPVLTLWSSPYVQNLPSRDVINRAIADYTQARP